MDLFSVLRKLRFLVHFVDYEKAESPGFLQGISYLLFSRIQQFTEFLIRGFVCLFMFW